jgi:hypothetical protein
VELESPLCKSNRQRAQDYFASAAGSLREDFMNEIEFWVAQRFGAAIITSFSEAAFSR